MSSVEDRQNSENNGQRFSSGPLQTSGLISQLSPAEQISFPNAVPQPIITSSLPPLVPQIPFEPFQTNYGVSRPTQPLPNDTPIPSVTRNLALLETQTDALTLVRSTTTSLRQPVVIPSTGKVSRGTMRPPQGRRWVMHLSATIVLIMIAAGTLLAVVPAGSNGEAGFNPFQPILNFALGGNSNPNLLAQQAATVTAVTQDGYESGHTTTYAGLPTAPPGSSGFDSFTYGQCTYWADYLYHQMTGFWVPWGGNAWQWAGGASGSGWIVSSTPHVPSIIVLQAGVQGASGYGHVAVVIGINSDGSVHTSNWNWYANGGGWARTSYWDFRPGSGVSFVWR